MEWVETTGKSIDEAKDRALDALGVDASEAEFVVVEEAKQGLFGLLRSEARVRARVSRTPARPKTERRDRRRGNSGVNKSQSGPRDRSIQGEKAMSDQPQSQAAVESQSDDGDCPDDRANVSRGASASGFNAIREVRPEASGEDLGVQADAVEAAEDFLAGLLDVFDVDYEIERREIDVDSIELAVTGSDLGLLIGPRGQTLAAIQDLTRTAVPRSASPKRIYLDIAGYREARREALEGFTKGLVAEVIESRIARVLDPMPAADRKVVHDTANRVGGVVTSSEGEDPKRRVVISPAG